MNNNVGLQRTDIVEIDPTFLFRWEEPQRAYVLLYPEGLVKLNSTAGEILAVVAQTVAVGDLLDNFIAKYNNPDIEDDILTFLEASNERGWVRIKR